eukprot:gnl/TRDRNA2_/TRDRNA2_181044_c0_seq1.p1 gnl/TRDRNA2_/TRDRNA2_181044_c0~~gnl/TRDRNA2_/TRDRNA2_181044_c0_seq1.p1  ORF type:complete len:303 (-),score=55.94 gnl/TRDRNA2_/TRDRNA2_181044_c0_seq1:50-958(-)
MAVSTAVARGLDGADADLELFTVQFLEAVQVQMTAMFQQTVGNVVAVVAMRFREQAYRQQEEQRQEIKVLRERLERVKELDERHKAAMLRLMNGAPARLSSRGDDCGQLCGSTRVPSPTHSSWLPTSVTPRCASVELSSTPLSPLAARRRASSFESSPPCSTKYAVGSRVDPKADITPLPKSLPTTSPAVITPVPITPPVSKPKRSGGPTMLLKSSGTSCTEEHFIGTPGPSSKAYSDAFPWETMPDCRRCSQQKENIEPAQIEAKQSSCTETVWQPLVDVSLWRRTEQADERGREQFSRDN